MPHSPWPPVYDDTYRPKLDQEHWFPELETMSPHQRSSIILAKLQATVRWAYEQSAFYRRKWDDAGVGPESLRSLDDFSQFPVVTKEELRDSQAQYPPFGSYLCVSESEVARIHGTSGTTGKPTAFAIGRDDWRRIANAHARVMWGMGLRPGDTIFFASFFSLYMGSWGALIGGERLGATCFPFGAGQQGQTLMAVRWLREMQPTALYSTPSYALYLAETARAEGVDPREFGVKILFFSGEPGASIPATKRQIEDTYGGICLDAGSTAEMSPWMSNGECRHRTGMHLWQDLVYAEVCDPKTYEPLDFGREGTIVYTHLERTSQPMIRFQSGDLTLWTNEPCDCGRTYPRLPRGIYGRIDDMFIVRGENIYPSAIEDTLRSVKGFGGEYRLVISRQDTMDDLVLQVEADGETATVPEAADRFKNEVEVRLRSVIGVRATVAVTQPGELPRTEFKARRVVDNRDLYHALGKET